MLRTRCLTQVGINLPRHFFYLVYLYIYVLCLGLFMLSVRLIFHYRYCFR